MPLLLRADASMPLLLRADASMPLLFLINIIYAIQNASAGGKVWRTRRIVRTRDDTRVARDMVARLG